MLKISKVHDVFDYDIIYNKRVLVKSKFVEHKTIQFFLSHLSFYIRDKIKM